MRSVLFVLRRRRRLTGLVMAGFGLLLWAQMSPASAQPVSEAMPTAPLTPSVPASIPAAPMHDVSIERPTPALPHEGPEVVPPAEAGVGAIAVDPADYDPSGRRDPFAAIIQLQTQAESDVNLPPLQRIALTEINLVGVVWGGYGFTAMVQTPDGKGYAIRRGTRMGPNNGVVTSITEQGLVVVERFTDIYGKKQEREFVRLLHQKEGSE